MVLWVCPGHPYLYLCIKIEEAEGKKEGMATVIKYVLTMHSSHFLYSSEDINVDDNQKDETKYVVQSHYNAITCNKTP